MKNLFLKNLYIEEEGKLRSYFKKKQLIEDNLQREHENAEKQFKKYGSEVNKMKEEVQ